MFNIDFKDIADKIIPNLFIKDRFKVFLYCLVRPLKTVNQFFQSFRNNIHYGLLFNAQVIYLEHYLNDQYDSVNRAIYIQDASNVEYNYFSNKIEARPNVYLNNKVEEVPPIYLKNKSEDTDGVVDYIVMVPSYVVFTQLVMRNQILQYNLAGKRFSIQIF